MRAVTIFVTVLLALSVTACAPVRLRPDQSGLEVQARREAALAHREQWSLRGRLAVSDGRDGGSGVLSWSQQGARFRFELNAPVTGKTWLLSGNGDHATLEGLRDATLHGPDATTLLRDALQWQLPVGELTWWVRGLRAPGARGDLQLRADGLPARIEQAGWRVDYLDYDTSVQPPMPRKLFAERGQYRVRLVVQQWTLP